MNAVLYVAGAKVGIGDHREVVRDVGVYPGDDVLEQRAAHPVERHHRASARSVINLAIIGS